MTLRPAQGHLQSSGPNRMTFDVLRIRLPEISDAFFEPHKQSFCVTLTEWHKISPSTRDVANLMMAAIRFRKLPGSEDMTLLVRYCAIEGDRTMVEIVVVTFALAGPTESEVQLAVVPVIAELQGGRDLYASLPEDLDLNIPDELKEPVQEFQKMNAGKRPVEPMHFMTGTEPFAIIRRDVWRSSGLPLPEGRRYTAQAFCNGLMCDSRLVFLREWIDHKLTGRKYEAHYDQKTHEALILATAGRPDRYLELTLQEEITRKAVIIHVIEMTVVELDPSDFQLTI